MAQVDRIQLAGLHNTAATLTLIATDTTHTTISNLDLEVYSTSAQDYGVRYTDTGTGQVTVYPWHRVHLYQPNLTV